MKNLHCQWSPPRNNRRNYYYFFTGLSGRAKRMLITQDHASATLRPRNVQPLFVASQRFMRGSLSIKGNTGIQIPSSPEIIVHCIKRKKMVCPWLTFPFRQRVFQLRFIVLLEQEPSFFYLSCCLEHLNLETLQFLQRRLGGRTLQSWV